VLHSLYGKLQNINSIKVNKTTIIEKGELPPQVLEVEDGSWSNDD
jgi:hypothetical protein